MLISIVSRLLLLAALWFVLTDGDKHAWLFGGPVLVGLAVWRFNRPTTSEGKLRYWRLLQFVPYFVARSIVGSCDVAWRAFHLRIPITPVVRDYTFRLPEGTAARVFFANCLNLLPGTLTANWRSESMLQIHLLTDDPQSVAQLQELERRVGLLFGHPWNALQEDVSV